MADLYTITAQQEALDTSDVTAPVRVMRITFTSNATGVVGTVNVPLKDYNAQTVNTAIVAYVTNIDAVAGL